MKLLYAIAVILIWAGTFTFVVLAALTADRNKRDWKTDIETRLEALEADQ